MHPDAERILHLGTGTDPQQIIEESTIDFIDEMRSYFSEFAKSFNGYSEGGSRFQEVKVYSIASSAADFMVFRNQIKLVVSNVAHGVIQIAFAHHVRGALDVNGQTMGPEKNPQAPEAKSQDLMAGIGPFRDVYWTYKGEKVTAAQVARYFFSEFIRATRDSRKSKAGNQALLEQIKTLLQEKGLDL
ncbi:MAG: hypothetical protein A2583_10640 [Bdellovibrionales bacterium RIFOXYD1_FULL_53_11]|nr:MAG: hypothetical protein A2583_10640 [Bdellovibrionales bacterium RIFOXYD1_FULL_53_11]